MESKKNTLHWLHIILTMVTTGLWLPIYVICAISNSIHNNKVQKERDLLDFKFKQLTIEQMELEAEARKASKASKNEGI